MRNDSGNLYDYFLVQVQIPQLNSLLLHQLGNHVLEHLTLTLKVNQMKVFEKRCFEYIFTNVTNTSREGVPTRTFIQSDSISGWVVLDQIRAIDKNRLNEKIGDLTSKETRAVKDIIQEILVE